MAADITVSNNTTAHNSESGIFLHSSTNIDVTGNTSFNNAKYQLLFSHNTVADNMANINVINNIFVSKESIQKCFYFTSNYNDLNFGSASGNIYARPIDDNQTFSIDTYNTSATTYDLAGWKTLSGYDANSIKSPKSIASTSEIWFEYNNTNITQNTSLESNYYIDLLSTQYSGSIDIQAYSSKILLSIPTPSTVIKPWISNKKIWILNKKYFNGQN